jgi:hypothetical protein
MTGGSIYFRDIWGHGVSNVKFINNTAYRYSHDELLWIGTSGTSSIVDNVEIIGNRFYFGDPVLETNAHVIGFYANAPAQLKNIQIHDNEIIGQASTSLIALEGGEKVDIFNNDLYLKVSNANNGAPGTVIWGRSLDEAANTVGTVKVRDNRTITLDSSIDISSVIRGENSVDFTGNQSVIINAPNVQHLINNRGAIKNNNIVVNGNVHRSDGGGVISDLARNVQDNTILINGYAPTVIRSRFGGNLTGPYVVTGNTITATKKYTNSAGVAGNANLFTLWGFAMNGHPMTISNNTIINGSQVELDESLTAFTVANTGSNIVTDRTVAEPYPAMGFIRQLTDATPSSQTVNICNNTFRGFHSKPSSTAAGVPTITYNCNSGGG